jgi:hypothetical protein
MFKISTRACKRSWTGRAVVIKLPSSVLDMI